MASRDTDVLLLLLSHFPVARCEQLWMMSGTSKKRRYIPIGDVFHTLPIGSSTALLQFHALTGCDTTSYFANHTKRSAWKVFKEHHHLLNDLGRGELIEETIKAAEAFVCRMYNVHITDSVDSARHVLFSKSVTPETMPPTSNALRFQLMRAHYQCMIWMQAACPMPDLPAPIDMEWKRGDAGLEPVLMSIAAIPESCLEMISCTCKTQCKSRRCKCRKSQLPCTSMCLCRQQKGDHSITCMNCMQ